MYQGLGVKTCKQPLSKEKTKKTTANVCFNKNQPQSNHVVMSLFTGAGGLDLGLEAAGFSIDFCVELDQDARNTLKANRPRWNLVEPGDIHEIDPNDLASQVRHKRSKVNSSFRWSSLSARFLNPPIGLMVVLVVFQDPRAKTLQAYLDIVEAVLPKVLLLENVQRVNI